MNVRKGLFERVNHHVRVIHRQRCLREVNQFVRIIDHQTGNVRGALDHLNCVRRFAARAHNFLMVAMTDEQDLPSAFGKANRFGVHFGDQRTRRINRSEVLRTRLCAH